MKKIFLFPSFFIILFLLTSSGCSLAGSDTTIVKGYFPEFKNRKISLSEIDILKTIPIDTSELSEKGYFKFRFERDSAGFYLLKIDNKNYITLVLDKESAVEIVANGKSIADNYVVEGSDDSRFLRDFEIGMNKNKNKVDSLSALLNKAYKSGDPDRRKNLESEYEQIFRDQKQNTILFIEQHCNSLASLMIINRRFGQRKILTDEDDYPYCFKLDSCLTALYPENKHVVNFQSHIQRITQQRKQADYAEKRVSIGKKAPDLELLKPDGNKITLSSLEGRYVLVYFWASTDENSRKMNSTVVNLYDQYKDKNFEVFAIALESYIDMWNAAIETDKLNWINVSDLLGIYSSAKRLYNVPDQLPFFFLLDKELVIRYKGSDVVSLSNAIQQLVK